MSYEQVRIIADQQATIRSQHLQIAELQTDLALLQEDLDDANATIRKAIMIIDAGKDQAEATREALA